MSGYSLISKKSTLQTGLKPIIPHPNPITNYPMFVVYTHVNEKDKSVLHTHNKLILASGNRESDISPNWFHDSMNDIFFVHITIPHYELNGADVGGNLEFNMDLHRLQVNTIYKIPFEEKIHSFILREDGNLDYYIHY